MWRNSARHSGRLLAIAASVAVMAGLLVAPAASAATPPQMAARGPVATQAQATTPSATHTSVLGPQVYVFTPAMPQSQIQATVNTIAEQQVSAQFGSERYALLFEPGTYGSTADPLVFQVGYYTEVAGLGQSPGDVVINGSVDVYNQCFNADGTNCSALDNFWRSMSNLTINVTGQSGCRSNTEFWAVSQAAPLRRVHINGLLSLMDYCTAGPQYSSGGFIADSAMNGATVINGSQQQFLVRNSSLDGWSNGVWNQVFAGVVGAPAQSFSATSGLAGGTAPYTTLDTTPVTEAEPFLSVGVHGRYQVVVPAVRRDSRGPDWTGAAGAARAIPLEKFFIARPGDPVGRINGALASGRDLILTPGVYHLDRSLRVRRPGTVVLGLGLATLIPDRGTPAITVAGVPGVKISGLIIQAGPVTSPVLLQFGPCRAGHPDQRRDGHAGHAATPEHAAAPGASCRQVPPAGPRAGGSADPGLIQDVYFRIGGAAPGRAITSLAVNNSDVILDNIWAWRADHGAGVGWTENTARTGIVVDGTDVTAYGLFVEHYQGDQVVWNGQRGEDIFFQNEMPYDPPSQQAWMSGPGIDGHPAFRVSNAVTRFQGYGMGSYCFFSQGLPIHASSAFVVPRTSGVQLHDVFTRFLNGSGGIDHVVNDTGAAVSAASPGPSDVVSYP